MKKTIITMILLFTNFLMAYTEEECEKNDVIKINMEVSFDQIEPRIIYLQEKDKVCLFVKAIDTNASLSIEKLPVTIYATERREGFQYFRVDKAGEHKITCRGCGYKTEAKIVVQTREEFQKFDEEKYRKDSNKYRKQLKPKQEKSRYKSDLDDYEYRYSN